MVTLVICLVTEIPTLTQFGNSALDSDYALLH